MMGRHLATIATIGRYTALESMRNRLLWIVGLTTLALVLAASFAGEMAITEAAQIQSGLLGAALRLLMVVVMAVYVVHAQVREIHDKGVELLLALPIPRSSYLLGKLLGFGLSAAMLAVMATLAVALHTTPEAALFWGLSLFFELLLVVGISLLCLMTFNQAPPALTIVLLFYLLCRMITAIRMVGEGPLMPTRYEYIVFSREAIHMIAALLPDLSRFTQSSWLIHGDVGWGDVGFVVGQSLIYLTLLVSAALYDLYRREF
uniref:ABC transporter permease n=1 Tax=Magnetococcus massalia (strain MO-1) TaxID=451514 RepID=A0A1S7LLS1_MAGMO|nr:membrane protein of unknown function [Candidatus Magnetococcus massalia]